MQDNKNIYAAYADNIYSKRFASKNPLRKYAHTQQYDAVANKVRTDETVLDAGCGEGVLSCLLAKKGVTVVGVDISGPNIVAAKKLAREWGVEDKTTFMVGDAENLPFPDASFDVVVSSHVLEHLPNFHKGLSEIHRVTRGKAVVALPTICNPASVIQAGRGSFWEISRRSVKAIPLGIFNTFISLGKEGPDEGYVGNSDLTHIWRFPWVMKKQLRAGNFEIERFEASAIMLPFFTWLLPVIKFLDRFKAAPILRNFGYGSTAVLRKK